MQTGLGSSSGFPVHLLRDVSLSLSFPSCGMRTTGQMSGSNGMSLCPAHSKHKLSRLGFTPLSRLGFTPGLRRAHSQSWTKCLWSLKVHMMKPYPPEAMA